MRQRLFLFFILIIFALLFSCAHTSKWGKFLDWDEYTLESLPTQEDYPDAGAIILLDQADLEIFSSGELAYSTLNRKMMVRILNERGHKYTNVIVPYSENSEVSNIKARTILPDGEIITLSDKEIYDITLYPDFIFYSDVRAKLFTMPAVEDGCVIEYSWTQTVRNFTYWTSWQFQHDEPTLIARYSVRCPSDWEINWKTYGVEIEPVVQAVPQGFKSTRKWEVRNLPPFIPEIGMPPGSNEIAHILFSPVGMSRWDQIGSWFYSLARERWVPHKKIRELAEELTKDAKTPKEKLRRIFEYVRDNIRYIAIEIGTGGYQPHFASSVLMNRYGDCKDMMTLIIALGRAVSLDVNPVIISTWYNGEVDTTIASQAHFNHAIALATLPDSTEIWMDGTEKKCAFGELPWYDQNCMVMVIDKAGKTVLRRTPVVGATENQSERVWEIKTDSQGNSTGKVTMSFNGAPANELRRTISMMQPVNVKGWFGRDLLMRFPDLNYTEFQVDNLDQYEKPLIISGKISSSHLIHKINEYFGFQPGVFSVYDWHVLFADEARKYNINTKYPLCGVDKIKLEYPEEWSPFSGIKTDSLNTKYGFCKWQLNVTNPGQLTYQRTFQLDSTFVSKDDYLEFRNFLRTVALGDEKQILFKKMAPLVSTN